jgi:hypothetical protein
MALRTRRPREEVLGEILALIGIVRAEVPTLSRSEILELIGEAGDPTRAARVILDEHCRRIARNMQSRRGSVIGPEVH